MLFSIVYNINKIDLTYTIPMGVKVYDSSPCVDVSESGVYLCCYLTLGIMSGGESCLGICSHRESICYPTSNNRSDLPTWSPNIIP